MFSACALLCSLFSVCARNNLELRKRNGGLGLGDRPDLLPDNGDDEMDNEMGPADH